VSGADRLPPRRFGALNETSAELAALATDRFVRDPDTTLEQQLLNVAQAQVEPEIPANRAVDDDGRGAVAVPKAILPSSSLHSTAASPINLTKPIHGVRLPKSGW
jgi:hypothetical protein